MRPKFAQVVHVAMEKRKKKRLFSHNKNWTEWGAHS
jgi:hypothetical protein